MRLKPALAAAVAALVLSSVVVANAAQLSLEGPSRMSAQSTVRCDDTVATTTTGAAFTSVTVSGIAAECAGRSLTVRVYATSQVSASAAATVPSGGGSVTVVVPSFTPTAGHKTYVLIGDWPVPSTWTFTAPVLSAVTCTIPSAPAVPCTATLGAGSDWSNDWPRLTHFNRFITVATASNEWVQWQVTFNLSSSEWPITGINRVQDAQGGLVTVSTSGCGVNPRTVTVRGTTGWGDYHRTRAGQSRELQIEASNMGGSGNLFSCP